MGPHVGMGMGPAQAPMGPMPPVSYPGCLLIYTCSSLILSLIRYWQDSLWVLGPTCCVALVISPFALKRFAPIYALHCHHVQQIFQNADMCLPDRLLVQAD